ncbi:hypothetical protein K9N68_27685 [Kovacikia minuta CCNUW1]|uniref:hypothetical protein n=1 Tax=Kovacikia minuta TaxID=2931930 RepID=UPI001CCCC46A|nr:hypothetical protein [Kovacikia minuta]UBF25351.1 hypothetical protein K9N68_27685 [Kovacikia minuta CCNUW1]
MLVPYKPDFSKLVEADYRKITLVSSDCLFATALAGGKVGGAEKRLANFSPNFNRLFKTSSETSVPLKIRAIDTNAISICHSSIVLIDRLTKSAGYHYPLLGHPDG